MSIKMRQLIIARKDLQIERLQRKILMLYPKGSPCSMQVEVSDRLEHEIKSEAVKEFAERLTENIYTLENRVDVDGIVLLNRIVDDIDNLIKEMTEAEVNE